MKKLLLLAIALALMVSGCAVFRPHKTSTNYTYTSTINPEDIEGGKYPVVASTMITPWMALAIYYQPEKDRLVVGVYEADNNGNLLLTRYFYEERGVLVVFQKNVEKREYENLPLADAEISPETAAKVLENLKRDLDEYKKTEKL